MKKVLFLIPFLFITVSCKKKNSSSVLEYELKADNTYRVFLSDSSKKKSITIPKEYNDKAVTEISGFRNNNYLESVKFYGNITTVDEGAFNFCSNLKTITVEKSDYYSSKNGMLYKDNSLIVYPSGKTDSIITIKENIRTKAFTLAPNLKKIIVNSNEVSENAFYYLDGLEEIVIEDKVTFLKNNFFSGNELKRLTIKNEKILENLNITNVEKIYVVEGYKLNSDTLSRYKKTNIDKIDDIVYDIYEKI